MLPQLEGMVVGCEDLHRQLLTFWESKLFGGPDSVYAGYKNLAADDSLSILESAKAAIVHLLGGSEKVVSFLSASPESCKQWVGLDVKQVMCFPEC